ncbi:MAG: iron ABC transporter permease [Phycisphaerales bacterium]
MTRGESRARPALGLLALGALLALVCAARLLVVRRLDGSLVLGWPGADLGSFRLGALACAASAGLALGVAGAVLQSLLRNPLASPFVLGVSSGAGCGVAVAAVIAAAAGAATPAGVALALPACLGAFAALGGVLLLSRRQGAVDPVTLVLAGVVVGSIGAAGTIVCEAMLPLERRGALMGWVLGRIPELPDAPSLLACLLSGLALLLLAAWRGPALDAAALSDDEARSLGVRVGRLRTTLFAACGVATATSVVLCGPIAFVGLLAPHVARAAVGARNRALALGSALAGAALLVGADALRQLIDVQGGRLPVGALTAVLGGVAFLVLLRRTAGGWIR